MGFTKNDLKLFVSFLFQTVIHPLLDAQYYALCHFKNAWKDTLVMCLGSLSLNINNDNFVLTDWYSSFQETQLYTRVAVAGFFVFIVEEVSLVNGLFLIVLLLLFTMSS